MDTIMWAKLRTCQREVAELTNKWYYKLAEERPWVIRKVSAARNSPLLFNTREVLKAVNEGFGCEVGGAKN